MARVYTKEQQRKEDIKLVVWIIAIFFIVVWLCTPPGNKLAQLCFFGNHTRHFIANIVNPGESTEYLFHKKNVAYLIDMDNKKGALREMDKAIASLPTYISDDVLHGLYKDRANLKIYCGDFKGALDDYIKVPSLDVYDKLKVALLFKTAGKHRQGLAYCNEIVDLDPNSYPGFACIADIYADMGKYLASVRVLDLLIDRSPKAKYYVERAHYKKLMGDMDGYNEDIAKAKEKNSSVDENVSLTRDTLYPKTFKLE